MKKVRTVVDYFNENSTLLLLYATLWGLDQYYDDLAQAALTNNYQDVAYRARRFHLSIPERRESKTSGYYILELIGKNKVI